MVLCGHGGGKAPALKRAVHDRARVARAYCSPVSGALARLGEFTVRRAKVNGQPGALLLDRVDISVTIHDIAEGQIQGVSSIVDPDKLRHPGPVSDLGALLGRAADPSSRAVTKRTCLSGDGT